MHKWPVSVPHFHLVLQWCTSIHCNTLTQKFNSALCLQISRVMVHLIRVHNTYHLLLYNLLFILFNICCLFLCLSRTMEQRSPLPRKDKRKRITKRTKKNRELLKRRRTGTKKKRVPSPEKRRYFTSIHNLILAETLFQIYMDIM